MKATFLVVSVAVGIGFASPAFATCTSYTDIFGNNSIRCADGRTGNLDRDQFGNTTAQIGGERVNGYRDSSGRTTVRIGDQRLNASPDLLDNTQRRSGDSRASSLGSIEGRVNCHRDTFGASTCR